jgi:hypothetical protein
MALAKWARAMTRLASILTAIAILAIWWVGAVTVVGWLFG